MRQCVPVDRAVISRISKVLSRTGSRVEKRARISRVSAAFIASSKAEWSISTGARAAGAPAVVAAAMSPWAADCDVNATVAEETGGAARKNRPVRAVC